MQGLHEIAMILMLQVGESTAHALLQRLVKTQLRDSTRANLDAVTESLQLVDPVLQSQDPALAQHLRHADIPPYFAVSWLLTWFAHNVDSAMVPRLFDLFLASHPLMPLYLYLAGVLEVRSGAGSRMQAINAASATNACCARRSTGRRCRAGCARLCVAVQVPTRSKHGVRIQCKSLHACCRFGTN